MSDLLAVSRSSAYDLTAERLEAGHSHSWVYTVGLLVVAPAFRVLVVLSSLTSRLIRSAGTLAGLGCCLVHVTGPGVLFARYADDLRGDRAPHASIRMALQGQATGSIPAGGGARGYAPIAVPRSPPSDTHHVRTAAFGGAAARSTWTRIETRKPPGLASARDPRHGARYGTGNKTVGVDTRRRACWPEVLTVVTWLWAAVLLFRVSAFRADRPGHHRYFGVPYLSNLKYFSRSNFVPEGHRLLNWFRIAASVFFVAVILAVSLC